MDFSTLRPVDYTINQPEITPLTKRMSDILTLADLMDTRKKKKKAEELSGKLGPTMASMFAPEAVPEPVQAPIVPAPVQTIPQAPEAVPEPVGAVTGGAPIMAEPPVPKEAALSSYTTNPIEQLTKQNEAEMIARPQEPISTEGYFEQPSVPDIVPETAPEQKTATGAKSAVAPIDTKKTYEPDFLTFTPQEKAVLNQAYQYGFEYGQPIYDKMLANKKLMAETYKLQAGTGPKPEDATKAFKLEAGKHQRITNMLSQATTPADIEAAIEEARRYGFDETKLSDNPDEQEISDWIREDQTMQQQLLGMRVDLLKGAKGKFPPIPGNEQPTQGQFYAYKMIKGDAPPDFSFVKGRGQDNQIVINDIYSELQKIDPNFSPSMAMSDYKYWTSAKTKQQRQAIDAFVTLAAKAKEATDKYKRLPAKFLNKPFMSVAKELGDVETARYISQLGVLTEDLGKAVAGGNSMTDDQLKFAQKILAQDYTPAQFEAAIDAALSGALERKHTIYAQGGVYGRNNARTEDASFWPGSEGEQIRQNILNPQVGVRKPAIKAEKKPTEKPSSSGAPPTLTTRAQVQALKPGSKFIWTDGKVHTRGK